MTDRIGGERWRLLAASAVGTIIEWYDFFIFATCAVLVFDKTFFPASSTYTGILLALSSYAIGFVARPLGGILFGTLGDRIGRKNTLVVSLALMGLATMLMGALPTYATVGMLAPALLVTLRILQGIAVGGEATGALTMVAESMPGANRGFWVSFPMLGGPVANVLAALTIIIIQRDLGEQAFVAWAWRLPFLFSGVLVLLGIWVRMRIEESPAFVALAKSRQGTPHAPLSEAFVGWGVPMLKVFLIKTSENTLFYLFTTFFLVLVTQFLALPRGAGLDALFWGSLLEAAVIMMTGFVADRIGRRPVLVFGLSAGLCAGFVLFTLDKGASAETVLWVTLATLTCHGIIVGGMAPFFTELFPTRVRYTAMSTAYQVASVVGGSVAPIVGTYLLGVTGRPITIALYATVMVIPGVLCALLSRETRGIDLTAPDAAFLTPKAATSLQRGEI
jgi:MFS family permease